MNILKTLIAIVAFIVAIAMTVLSGGTLAPFAIPVGGAGLAYLGVPMK